MPDQMSDPPAAPPPGAITPERLHFVLTIAREASYSRAAAILKVPQSRISREVTALEECLGLRLLDRTQGGATVTLTSHGQRLATEAERVLSAVEEFSSVADGIKRGREGIISIACYPVHVSRILAAVIADFQKTHPKVRFDLTRMLDPLSESAYETRFDMLDKRWVDFAIGPAHPGRDFEWVKLYHCNIVVATSPDSPLRSRPAVPVEELRDHSVLIAPEPYPTRAVVNAACERAGFRLSESVEVESTNPIALMALGRNGPSLAIVPDDHPPIGSSRNPYPVLVDEQGQPVGIEVCLHWHDDDEPPEHVADFVDCAKRWAHVEREEPFSAALDVCSAAVAPPAAP